MIRCSVPRNYCLEIFRFPNIREGLYLIHVYVEYLMSLSPGIQCSRPVGNGNIRKRIRV